MRPVLPLPSRIFAQASVVRTLLAQIQEPSPERVLSLETHLTSLATDADVDRYIGAMRACGPPGRCSTIATCLLPTPSKTSGAALLRPWVTRTAST